MQLKLLKKHILDQLKKTIPSWSFPTFLLGGFAAIRACVSQSIICLPMIIYVFCKLNGKLLIDTQHLATNCLLTIYNERILVSDG